MRLSTLKKCLLAGSFAGVLLGVNVLAYGAEAELTPGVTVVADENSATGYTATFVYEDADATEVNIVSGFAYYYDDGSREGDVPEKFYTPFEWEDGMFPAQVNRYVAPLEKVEGTDYWTIALPLASGHYQYYYTVDGTDDVVLDPANMPLQADVEGGGIYEASTVDVPWDPEKQANTRDYSFAMEREDGQTGEVFFVNYTDCNGVTQPMGIYLPYGYDAEREEAYKVLYISHGGGGNETHWFAGTNVNYIFDNLIAEGKMEPTLIVTMNNSNYLFEERDENGRQAVDCDTINKNILENIIPYVEENYNVGTGVSDRAFAGQSMGGRITSHLYGDHAEEFGYFGIFSGYDSSLFEEYMDISVFDADKLKAPKMMLGMGIYDFAYEDFNTIFRDILDEIGVTYDYYEVEGAHDWYIWQQLIKIFAEDYLWK